MQQVNSCKLSGNQSDGFYAVNACIDQVRNWKSSLRFQDADTLIHCKVWFLYKTKNKNIIAWKQNKTKQKTPADLISNQNFGKTQHCR